MSAVFPVIGQAEIRQQIMFGKIVSMHGQKASRGRILRCVVQVRSRVRARDVTENYLRRVFYEKFRFSIMRLKLKTDITRRIYA
jgi:hypothetical protein